MERTPDLGELILDFRSDHPKRSAKSKSTTRSIQLATAIQEAAANFVESGVGKLPLLKAGSKEEIERYALRARAHFRISVKDQIEAADDRVFYNICRRKIERRGIFVLHDSFPEGDGSGFCLADSKHPVVVVNTKRQTRGRRLFTLIHELGHVLMQLSGISDPFSRQNEIERLCNRFAGCFLVPAAHAERLLAGVHVPNQPDIDDVKRIARRLKISQQATVLRLEQLGIVKSGTHERWLTAIHNIGNPDFTDKRGGAGGPPPQEQVKLAKYGFRFAAAFDGPLEAGSISDVALFRFSGLKPKFQRDYINYANAITNDELQTLELGDG
jgi:Zn-dependent peptidase ImmA (M78 family)